MQAPERDAFLALAAANPGKRIPVYRDLLADLETPLSAYWKLSHDEPHSFLLESVTGGESLARYSILGVRPREVVRGRVNGNDPLEALVGRISPTIPLPGMPKFVSGAVGLLSYDYVRSIERLPDNTSDDLGFDDLAMMLVDATVVFDHARNIIRLVVATEGSDAGYTEAEMELDRLESRLKGPLPPLPAGGGTRGDVTSNTMPERFKSGVQKIIDYIFAGVGIQVVLSQRFETPSTAHPLSVYRSLRSLNPSPYMFLLRMGDFDIVGASPEVLTSLDGRRARVRPIAGTRPRGTSPEDDHDLERDLLADEKEIAEHIMLVDLGRNDLGKVCDYGSVTVNELMTIERYSHVMHIVSDVTGHLRDGLDAVDLVRGTFPAGTVSGAPKVRAMEIIDELEPTRRGLYAGAVGYFDGAGGMDLAIAIRTILLKDGKAYVQAGAGIVYDSNPDKEFEETVNKAAACLRAVKQANNP